MPEAFCVCSVIIAASSGANTASQKNNRFIISKRRKVFNEKDVFKSDDNQFIFNRHHLHGLFGGGRRD